MAIGNAENEYSFERRTPSPLISASLITLLTLYDRFKIRCVLTNFSNIFMKKRLDKKSKAGKTNKFGGFDFLRNYSRKIL